jgi:hypothetical protein
VVLTEGEMMKKVKFEFSFCDSRDLPGMSFYAYLKKKLDFVPFVGMTVWFSHWHLDFHLEVSSVTWDIKTNVFDVTLRDHEGALDFQEWDAMEPFFLEQGWKVVFYTTRPGSDSQPQEEGGQ